MDVALSADDGELRVAVTGSNGDQSALSRIRDRVEATGGSVSVDSSHGDTAWEACFPAAPQGVAAAQA